MFGVPIQFKFKESFSSTLKSPLTNSTIIFGDKIFTSKLVVYKIPYRRACALGRVRRASKGILHTTKLDLMFFSMERCATRDFVYKIPYRRARAWPSGCIGL